MHAVDQPGRCPGLSAISAARDTRLLCPPVTRTTGVAPRRPQARPYGGLNPLGGLVFEDQPGAQVRRRPLGRASPPPSTG